MSQATDSPSPEREDQVELLLAMSSRLRTGTNEDLESALALATGFFGLDFGIVSRIEGEDCVIEHLHCPAGAPLEVGQRFDLGAIYCALTLAAQDVVAIEEAGSLPHEDRSRPALPGVEAYIGVPVLIDGQTYGTLSFSSLQPRRVSWTQADRMLTRILARWVAGSIKQRHLAERLEQTLYSLDQANLELDRKNRDLTAFISAASHDLKEPLRNVGVLAEFLREDALHLGSAAEQTLEMIENTARRGQALVEDLLDFARVSRHEPHNERVDLSEVVTGVLGDLRSRITLTKGMVSVGELPTLWIDRFHARQLMQNLIGNALKYHRPGVPPEVRVEAELAGGADPATIELRVADNGIGFEEEHAQRIFKPFNRLHGGDVYEGTGIGLAICARIAERLGGTITATSQPGVGSTFRVRLPVRRAAEAATPDAA